MGGFAKGCSLIWVIVIYVVVVVFMIFLYRWKQDFHFNHCIFELDPSPTGHVLWDPYVEMVRGDDYFVAGAEDDPTRRQGLRTLASACPITVWPLTHFAMYACLGFVAPKLAKQLFCIGVLWEGIEYLNKCQCLLDIFWNLGGLTVGIILRQWLCPVV